MNIFTCSFALRCCLDHVDIIGMNAKKIDMGTAGDCQEASDDNGNGLGYWRLWILVANIYSWTKTLRSKSIPCPSVGVLVTSITEKPSLTTVAHGLSSLILLQWTGTVVYTLVYDLLG